ncbi:hypothetical protein SUGI_0133630 [Cryptomeria japonica]|nr:hypothetical protein SUGI_0133630 [Cryptomeria japonica]
MVNVILELDASQTNCSLLAYLSGSLDDNAGLEVGNSGGSLSSRKRKDRDVNNVNMAWETFKTGVMSNDFAMLRAIFGSDPYWKPRSIAKLILDLGYGQL